MTGDLRAKLARLRREAPAGSPAETPPERTALPGWFAARRVEPSAPTADEIPGAPRRGGPPEGLVEESSARGSFAVRRALLAPGALHGDQALSGGLAARGAEYAWLAGDPALAELEPRSAVYLDIETTGLSGGAGTIPFLVALGRFTLEGFELWQAFLREPREEAAALQAVAERVRASSGVVSFFGKSFDRHRLEDKMRLHRIAAPFAERPHLDLYHPLRRLYRGAYDDARLATYERHLCGVERGFDLPGRFAPEAWFDFLAGRAHRLEGVFRHNALDVLSLVTLAAHLAWAPLGTRPDGRPLPGCARSRERGLAERHAAEGDFARAIQRFELALTHPGGDGRALIFRRAECLRRCGRSTEALEAFVDLARQGDDLVTARAWLEVLRLARRTHASALEAEARDAGPEAARRALGGRALEQALERYARPSGARGSRPGTRSTR